MQNFLVIVDTFGQGCADAIASSSITFFVGKQQH